MKRFFESQAFILLFLVFILVSYGLALWFKLLYLFWWLDMAHHFLGGAWIALFFNWCAKRFSSQVSASAFLSAASVLGAVALAGVFWEFFEFILNRYVISIGFLGYEDTLSDLFFDLLGGALAFLVIL